MYRRSSNSTRSPGEFIAATYDKEIEVAVIVDVEERCAGIFLIRVCRSRVVGYARRYSVTIADI